MFCSECGTKNPDGAKFCENCGAPLEVEEATSKKASVEKTESKKEEVKKDTEEVKAEVKEKVETAKKAATKVAGSVSKTVENKVGKKNVKPLIIVCIILVVALIGGYKVLESKASPAVIAEEYVKAIENKDYDKLYEMAAFSGDTTFISKDNFKRVFDETFKEAPFSNYVIDKNVSYTNGNLTALVGVNFTGTSNNNSEAVISLSKEKGKKYVFFDNWKIENPAYLLNYSVIKDYKIEAPAGSKVTYDGVELADTYIVTDEKEVSKENAISMNVYKLPQVFAEEAAKIECVLPYGDIKVSDDVRISEYSSPYSVKIDIANVPEELKNTIKTALQNDLTVFENNLASGKSFAEQKAVLSAKKDLSNLEKNYDSEKQEFVESTRSISDFAITEMNLTSLKYTQEYTFKAELTIKYTYKITNKTTGEVKDENDTWYLTAYINYEDGAFKIYNLSSLDDFSFYYWWW